MTIFDYIKLPFAYLLEWLTTTTGSYALALFLFALIVKLVLLPASAKSKKSMMKMSRVTPKVKALEAQYADDRQKYQEEVNKLYKEEGVSTCGGCIWSLLPLLLLIPLYEVIRQPITWQILHGNFTVMDQIKTALTATPISGIELNNAYWEMSAITRMPELIDAVKAAPEAAAALQAANPVLTNPATFTLFGINLSAIPQWKLWTINPLTWNEIGQFLIPVVSGGFNLLSMLISQKMNNQVVVDENGQKDAEMAKAGQASNKLMNYMMPLMSVIFGFMFPAGLSIYWIAQAIIGIVQDYFLTKHYKKVYDEEDAVKREIAAKHAAEEAERERLRAERRAANPDGITANTSKKKLEQQKRAEKAAAEAAYQAKQAELRGETPEEPAVDAARPFSRGRAYRADRYDGQNNEE